MKKTILFGAAALVMLAACNKQEAAQPESQTFTLSATVEQQEEPGTKSTLSGTTVSWTASTDVIKVYNADGSANTDLTAQSSGTSTTFSGGDLSGVPTVAIFPAGIASGYNGSVISFTLPSSQDYVANSFDADANVAVASVSASSLAFKNVCGTLKLSVTGNYTVSKIEVTGANNEKLWGAFKTTVATEPVLSVDGDPTTAEKTLTLNCGAGVALDSETATVFYIVVPQGVFASGFTAKIYSKEAEDASETYTFTTVETASNNTVNRSRIRVMPKNDIVPPAYQKVDYVERNSSGSVGFDTGFKLSSITTSLYVKVKAYTNSIAGGEADFIGSANTSASPYGFCIGRYSGNTFFLYTKMVNTNDGGNASIGWHVFEGLMTNETKTLTIDGVVKTGGQLTCSLAYLTPVNQSDICIMSGGRRIDSDDPYCSIEDGGRVSAAEVTIDGVKTILVVPVYRKSDGVIGFYDQIREMFYTNFGPGTVTYGSVINH